MFGATGKISRVNIPPETDPNPVGPVSIVLQEVTDQTHEASFSISGETEQAHSSAETHSSLALQDLT